MPIARHIKQFVAGAVLLAWTSPSRAADDTDGPAEPPSSQWTFAFGPEVGAMTGVGPYVAPVAGLSYAFALRTARVLAPSLHLSADVAGTERGSTAYRWVGGAVRACPIHALLLARRLRLAPCGSLQAALYQGFTSTPRASSQEALWLAPVAGGSVLFVATSTMSVELHGGAVFPLKRARFVLEPDTTIHRVPAIAATTMLTLHLRFF